MIIKSLSEELYKVYVVTNDDSVKKIGQIPTKRSTEDFFIKGTGQDASSFFIFFGITSEVVVLLLDKSSFEMRWVVYPNIMNSQKERLLNSFIVKDKYYTLIGNKKTDEISFYQFTVTIDSLQKKTIKFKGENNEYDLLNGNYFVFENGKDNSIYRSTSLHKIFEMADNKFLLIAESDGSGKFIRGVYFFEYDFDHLTMQKNKLIDEIYRVPATKQIGKGFVNAEAYSTNSFIHGNKFYKMWMHDSILINVYDLKDLSLAKQILLTEQTFTQNTSGHFRINDNKGNGLGFLDLNRFLNKRKDSSNLTNGKYIMRQLRKGTAVICANGKDENITLGIGTEIIEYSGGGGFVGFGGGRTIMTPSGPGFLPGMSTSGSGGRYVSGENIKYFNLTLNPTGEAYTSVFEKIDDFVNNKDDDFKHLENYPNSIYKLGDKYVLSFLYKKNFYRYTF